MTKTYVFMIAILIVLLKAHGAFGSSEQSTPKKSIFDGLSLPTSKL